MQFPYGAIVGSLPSGYAPRQQWPEYDQAAQVPAFMRPRSVGSTIKGIQWGLWPIMFEEYVSDDEPSTATDGPNRVIIWQRLTRRNVPDGWLQMSRKPGRVEGFALLDKDDHRRTWSESARRYARKWQTDFLHIHYDIEEISFDEFCKNYLLSTVAKKAQTLQLDILAQMLANDACAPHVTLWGARNIQTEELVAGLAIVTSQTHRASYYQAGFIKETPDNAPAMIGLMDHWFMVAKERGVRILMFGGFWHPGLPKKVWGGFSAFKAKFGLQYIEYAPPLMRFKRGTFLRKT